VSFVRPTLLVSLQKKGFSFPVGPAKTAGLILIGPGVITCIFLSQSLVKGLAYADEPKPGFLSQ
jgi:hypothetical protein